MTQRTGKRGDFLGYSRYPWCKTTAPLREVPVAPRSQTWVMGRDGHRIESSP
ncbi:hypothetical protein G3T36_02625 [Diaminobutyricibacter tongyongensis]|uniref:Uncharacterized protein n=2 Tax=Leifsonia tongyongensis TaxID=1268043 RepID=A0A6L9XTZ7_9MICO|nr:hypothetical protein [Diaminobutyricibacter tongyongensis]